MERVMSEAGPSRIAGDVTDEAMVEARSASNLDPMEETTNDSDTGTDAAAADAGLERDMADLLEQEEDEYYAEEQDQSSDDDDSDEDDEVTGPQPTLEDFTLQDKRSTEVFRNM
ncbi:hypothetical protein HDV00_007555 [Rhizophlyctis rosea]|nr:hypothetical protein HDV00_007555 [Rhizophlyctis rosea]